MTFLMLIHEGRGFAHQNNLRYVETYPRICTSENFPLYIDYACDRKCFRDGAHNALKLVKCQEDYRMKNLVLWALIFLKISLVVLCLAHGLQGKLICSC